jgi:UDP-N-acetylglucosamine--N-acetylmuramyl-(pentapeptide) pyrophosphoryl-undecaprenol N-acetylglucosamine transferase
MKNPQDKSDKKLRIILAGGGSGGSIAPLLAIAESIKGSSDADAEILIIGTKTGPERIMADGAGLEFRSIPAGKLRRYFSWNTLIAPFLSLAGFFAARRIIKKFNADIIIGAGAYVSVPVGYAAWSLGKKLLIHQQDLVPSLSNILLAPIADKITVSLPDSLRDFTNTHVGIVHSKIDEAIITEEKCVFTGNPVGKKYFQASEKASDEGWKNQVKEKFGIHGDWPILFLTGGGKGATALNTVLEEALPELLQRFEIIHSTGKDKHIKFTAERYHQFEFISDMPEVYAITDIVVSRAGMNAISELSAESKVAVIIPMPDSHQEKNALYLHKKDAAMVYAQELVTAPRLVSILTQLLYDTQRRTELEKNISELMPRDATQEVCKIILNLCQKNL